MLRLIVERDGGAVSLADCAQVSRLVSHLLDELAPRVKDEQPLLAANYHLEVSSPGVFRRLKKPQHFFQSRGKWVRFVLLERDADGQTAGSRSIRGLVASVDTERVQLSLEGGETVSVPWENIVRGRLDPQLP